MTKINQEQNETALPQTQWEKFETEVRQRVICELQKNIIVTRPEDGHVHVTLGENGEIHFGISPDGVTYEVENLEPLGNEPSAQPVLDSGESLESSNAATETTQPQTPGTGTTSIDAEPVTEEVSTEKDADLI